MATIQNIPGIAKLNGSVNLIYDPNYSPSAGIVGGYRNLQLSDLQSFTVGILGNSQGNWIDASFSAWSGQTGVSVAAVSGLASRNSLTMGLNFGFGGPVFYNFGSAASNLGGSFALTSGSTVTFNAGQWVPTGALFLYAAGGSANTGVVNIKYA